MATLFHSIEELKQFVSGAVDNDQGFLESIESDILNAALLHIAPWTGNDLLEYIIGLYPDTEVDSKEYGLTEKIQRALAPLALYHASKTKNVRFGTEGLTKSDKAAFRYQEAEYREEMLIAGYEHIELLLRYLEANQQYFVAKYISDYEVGSYEQGSYSGEYESYLEWAGRERHFSRIMRYAADFREASSHRVNRYTFEFLLPIIDEIEYHAIEKNLPRKFFERITNAKDLNKSELKALLLIKKMIASCTIEEALRRQLVTLDKGMLVHNEAFGDQAGRRQTMAPLSYTEKAHSWEKVASNRMWIRLREFVEKTPSVFPLIFHINLGGTNEDPDAWGYIKPITQQDEELRCLEIERLQKKKVIGF